MATQTTTIGGNTVPAPASIANPNCDDVTLLGLLDYFGFWIKYALDARLSTQLGAGGDACPLANRFPYDPGKYFVRNDLPALYIWHVESKYTPKTVIFDERTRTLGLMYIYEELVAPDALGPRHGVVPAVDATFFRAVQRGNHPSYGYGNSPAGTPIILSLNLSKLLYKGGKAGFLMPVPAAAPRSPNDGPILRGYPALQGQIEVSEIVNVDQMEDSDLAGDFPIHIETGDTTSDTVTILDGYLPAPDGEDDE